KVRSINSTVIIIIITTTGNKGTYHSQYGQSFKKTFFHHYKIYKSFLNFYQFRVHRLLFVKPATYNPVASVQQPAAATHNLEPAPPLPGARLSAAETSAHRPRAFVTPIKNGGFSFTA